MQAINKTFTGRAHPTLAAVKEVTPPFLPPLIGEGKPKRARNTLAAPLRLQTAPPRGACLRPSAQKCPPHPRHHAHGASETALPFAVGVPRFLFCLPPRRGNKREKHYRKEKTRLAFPPPPLRGTGGTDRTVPPIPKGVAEPRRCQGTEKIFPAAGATQENFFPLREEPLTPPRTCRRGLLFFSLCKLISNGIYHSHSFTAVVK